MIADKIPYTLKIHEPFHVGTGAASAVADNEARAASEALRTTFKGRLRNEAVRLIADLGGDLHAELACAPASRCWVCAVFGRRGDAEQRYRIPAPHLVTGAEVTVETLASYDPSLRRAAHDRLFTTEFLSPAVYEGEFMADDHDLESDDRRACRALLVASALRLESIGAGRTRDGGTCRVEIAPAVAAATVNDLELLERDAPVPHKRAPGPAPPAPRRREPPERGKLRSVLTVRAEALDPLVLGEAPDTGNERRTRTEIGGRQLLGAVARRLIRDGLVRVEEEAFRIVFQSGDVSWGALLPGPEGAIVSPLSLYRCKRDDAHPVIDALRSQDHVCAVPECGAPLEQLGDMSLLEDGVRRSVGPPEPTPVLRTAISHATQAALDGALVATSELPAGTVFHGTVAATPRGIEVLERLGLSAGSTLEVVAGAKRTTHGAVRLHLQQAPALQHEAHGEIVTMLLLGDTIVPDPWLRYRTALDAAFLAEMIGIEIDAEPGYSRTRVVTSFEGAWGTWREPEIALVAGSCIRFVDDGSETAAAALEQVAREGIGVRRREGFGRVAFDHPVFAADLGVAAAPTANGAPPASPQWVDGVLERLTAIAAERDAPSRSQRGQLREVLYLTDDASAADRLGKIIERPGWEERTRSALQTLKGEALKATTAEQRLQNLHGLVDEYLRAARAREAKRSLEPRRRR